MENKKLLILIILGIAAIFSLIYGIITPSKAERKISQKSDTLISETKDLAGEDIFTNRRAKRSTYTSWGRNPFSLDTGRATTMRDLILNGVLWDENEPAVIINDEILGIGDKIGLYTIVDIQKDKVILNDGTKNCELCLPY
jgi:hypothetical protein